MTQVPPVPETVKSYILREVLEGASPSEVTNTTSLISGGIFDSIATLRVVAFLEQEYSISIEAQDVDAANFDTIDQISAFIGSQIDAQGQPRT